MAAGDGSAGAVPTFSLAASGADTKGTTPVAETDRAEGALMGEALPPTLARVCGDLEKDAKVHDYMVSRDWNAPSLLLFIRSQLEG